MIQRLIAILSDRTTLAAVLRNSSWLVGERLFRMLVGFFVGVWVARYLGPESFGSLSLALATFAVFGPVANLGLDAIVVRDLARNPERSGAILGTAAALKVAGAAGSLLLALVACLALWSGEPGQLLVTMIVCLGLLAQPADVVDWWFQANLRSRLTVTSRLAALALSAAVKVGLILMQAPLYAFAAAVLIEFAAAALALLAAYRRFPSHGGWSIDTSLARSLLRDSWPMLLSSLAIVVYLRIDQFMLSRFAGNGEVGIYAAVLPLVESWFVVPVALSASAAPVLARLHSQSPALFTQRMKEFLRYMAAAGLMISACVALGAHSLVHLLLGPGYERSADVLAILVWINFFVFVAVAENQWVVANNRGYLRIQKTVVGALTSVALNLVLVPRYGALGAAIAALAAHIGVVLVVNALFARDLLQLELRAFAFR
jgi:PST family polysaccharide transporter